jgi:hypothetical protein
MIRSAVLGLYLTVLVALLVIAGSARAATVADLGAALRLGRMAEILSAEGVAHGAELEQSLFPDQGGARWAAIVAALHDPARMRADLEGALGAALADAPAAEVDAMTAFFTSGPGAGVIDLELDARAALADPAVQDAADLALDRARADKVPRLGQIDRFIVANDLIERNVAGAMNANIAFWRGLSDGDGLSDTRNEGEAEMLADLWTQQESLRAETEAWLWSFLLMAYDPLEDDALEAYIDFSLSPAGQRLNTALFETFDTVFERLSYDLGKASARLMTGESL